MVHNSVIKSSGGGIASRHELWFVQATQLLPFAPIVHVVLGRYL